VLLFIITKTKVLVGALKIFKRRNRNRLTELDRQMGVLRGYRKRAEGHRRRAFKEWQLVSEG
jgi:hypothetical protein